MLQIIPEWNIRDRVRKAREVAGFRQTDLAVELGISRATLASIEQGLREPRRGELIAIAYATGVDLHWLMTGEDPVAEDCKDT